ncbi:RagB/SusD family nutrient uptake outer membrane protein [Pedobacter sp. HMWF019]|uniref:RagB/SusD family nutrient uptake outer membrane protein n=1 Tax=Pedobacter sp. HMWF019 TaxID=2056856 RepID=UPI000D3B68D2|nr:RagB/SusD family nutrient uptake outer membrane protein [Pedobacter sp. HMWF019]PTS96405.1 RagB/SusD family nutrient uptake outer membrane protein [Pedobacter sp. HMWF019]
MKKYLVIISAILLVSVISCKKGFLEEDPKGSILPQTFYKSSEDLNQATLGIAMIFNGAWNQTGGLATTYGSDDVTVFRGGNKLGFSDFDSFQANSSNDRMTNWWNYFYKTIKSSNSLIQNYPGATEATPTERNNAAGVAYFYRAISYFFLTRTWGAVPLITEPSIENNRPNVQPQEIYTLIVSDLQKAETMLPDNWTGVRNQNGVNIQPTRGSAKALLANVYLTMAGWPLKQSDKYALAAVKAKEVMDNKATWGFQLLPNFADVFAKEGKFNHEAVFGCYYNNQAPGSAWENGSQMGPLTTMAGEEGGWDEVYGEISFYNNFPAGPRKEATYQSVYYLNNNPNTAVNYMGLLHKHPYFMKYIDDISYDKATHKANDWWGSHTIFIIRYAEVLLTYAEAKAMSSAPDQSAYDAINAVRTRAGLANLTPGLPQMAFRDAVIAERGWEFAGLEPASRWFDLIRTETVGKANSNRDVSEVALAAVPNDASHTFYWAPLPVVK